MIGRFTAAIILAAMFAAIPGYADDDLAALTGELKVHEANLAEAKIKLEQVAANSKGYRSFMAGKIDQALRKKILASGRDELTETEKHRDDLESRIKYFNGQIARDNQNAKIWAQELRDYNEEIPSLELKARRLAVAVAWLDGGKGKPPHEVIDVRIVQNMFHEAKVAEAVVSTEQEKVDELKKKIGELSEEAPPPED